MSETHFICPGCGAEIRVGPRGCPKCTRQPKPKKKPEPRAWEQDDIHDGLDLDLPEDDSFDYDKFVADEFGGPQKRSGKEWLWWVTGVILLSVLVYLWI
ncbi:MAG: hypothetical protein ACI8XO_000535 [Verrucomicrobiales bacterium]|jgi:hypothetical protein